eukprot:6204380-Pleurochrysis_carterae.AAC.1
MAPKVLSRSAWPVDACIISAEQPLYGRARSESVARTGSLRPRTPEPGVPILSKSLPGNYQNFHPGGQERRNCIKYSDRLSDRHRPSRAEFQELGERSASAPQVCMRHKSKTANSACVCQTASERCAARNDSL